MTPRERVARTMRFAGPDHVPFFRWDQPDRSDIVGAWLGLEDRRDDGAKQWTDAWGCIWATDHTDIGQVVGHPISGPDKYAGARIPVPSEDLYAAVFNRLKPFADRFRFAGIGSFFFQELQLLRGFDGLMIDLLESPDDVAGLADRLIPFYLRSIDRFAASGVVDGIMVNEDIGLQSALMISPAIWRTFFKPRYRIVYDYAHAKGLTVFQHSCGYILDILPDLAEIGVDVVECHQLACMGIGRVAAAVRGKLAVTAPVDIQSVLPAGDEAAIRQFLAEMFAQLATPAGGLIAQTYMSCHDVGASKATVALSERIIDELRYGTAEKT